MLSGKDKEDQQKSDQGIGNNSQTQGEDIQSSGNVQGNAEQQESEKKDEQSSEKSAQEGASENGVKVSSGESKGGGGEDASKDVGASGTTDDGVASGGVEEKYLQQGAKPKKRSSKPSKKHKTPKKSDVEVVEGVSTKQADGKDLQSGDDKSQSKDPGVEDKFLLEGAKPKKHATKGEGPKPPEKPAVQFFDWDSKSYKEKDPFLEQEAAKGKDQDKGPLESGIVQQGLEDAEEQLVKLAKEISLSDLGAAAPLESSVEQVDDKTGGAGAVKPSTQLTSVGTVLVIVDPARKERKNIVYCKDSLIPLHKDKYSALSNQEYHIAANKFKIKLSIFQSAHIKYCCCLLAHIFHVEDLRVHVNTHMDSLLGKITDPRLCIFMMQIGLLINFAAVVPDNHFCTTLAYNARLWWDKSIVNVLSKKFLTRIRHENIDIPVLHFYFSRILPSPLEDRAVHSPVFYKRMLNLLCELVKLRLCDPNCTDQHDVLEFGIVHCALLFGTMYKHYGTFMRNSGKVSSNVNFSGLVMRMGPASPHRGVFGKLCVGILRKLTGMYNLHYNESVLVAGIHMPAGIVSSASEGFCDRISQCVNSSGMDFSIVVNDLAMQVCRLLDRMHLTAVEEEIKSYRVIYNKLVNDHGDDKRQGPSR